MVKTKRNGKQRNGKKRNGNFKKHRTSGGETELMCSSKTDPKKLAGKLNSIVLNGDPPQLFSIGVHSTNQLVKALAISRFNCRAEKIDLLVQPRLQRKENDDDDDLKDAYIFALRKGPARSEKESTATLKVASGGNPGNIAGAIAHKVRKGERVALHGVGPYSVNIAVRAVIIARKYLIDDGMDLGFRPKFHKTSFKGDEKVGMVFNLFASQS